jgi:putative holliday junction resolvase
MAEPAASGPQLVMGFDFGLRRIGIAAGDSLTGTAQALQTIAHFDSGPDWKRIGAAIQEWRPALVVVGLPYNADGSESALSGKARAFAGELGTRFEIRVALVDERYSSVDAGERLKGARAEGLRRRRVRKQDLDAEAACVILERWFAQHT